MSFQVSFRGLNDGKALNSDAFHALDDGADIREVSRTLIQQLSSEIASVFGYDAVTVRSRWLQIEWDLRMPVSVFYNAGMYSAAGKLIYSPLFLADLVNRFGRDALVGVLSHEVGHRLVYLLLTQKGYRVSAWENECCADYVAGLLIRLGQCSPNGMMRFYTEYCAQSSATHPAGRARADAFTKGYRMIDGDRRTVFLRVPEFCRGIDTKQVLTPEFMQEKLLQDVLHAR